MPFPNLPVAVPQHSTHRGRQVTQHAEAVTMLQAQRLERVRHDQALDLVVRGRHTLKTLEALERNSTTLGLVGHHAACMQCV
eukprot:365270-Chlamydomonas_euryale.AAC.5